MAVVTEDLKELIFGVFIRRRYSLSYRRYRKLTPEEKAEFDKYKKDYDPEEWGWALILKDKLKVPFHHRLFRQVHRFGKEAYLANSSEWMSKYRTCSRGDTPFVPGNTIKDKFLEQEFIFQGFVPLDKYKIKLGYNYIASNRAINGKFYIYPKRLYGSACYSKGPSKRHPVQWEVWAGVPGCTRTTQGDEQVKSLILNQKWQIRQS